MACIDSIINGVLTICINLIHIQTIFNKGLDNLGVTILTGIKQWGLLEIVFLQEIYSKLNHQSEHRQSFFLLRTLHSCKAQILIEDGSVDDVPNINVELHQLHCELVLIS
jgi:hypothetical protein